MFKRCVEDAACKATSEMKAITSQLLQDAAVRDQRLAERDAAMAERAGLVKVVSEKVVSPHRWMENWTILNNECKNNGSCLRTDGRTNSTT